MNEQQLQQILTIQQAIAAAATAAMINTLLNPQQAAANLVNQNALTESPTTPNTDFHEQDTQDNNQTAPTTTSLTDNNNHHNNQFLHQHHQRQDNQVAATIAAVSAAATSSNTMISQAASQSPNNNHSNKKLKRHNQAPQAFSRQHNSPSSSSAFLPNNVGLPRKLVRGQDVWLGRGAEQTRQILKCMWCNQSFRTLAEMTQHMKITQHYTNIISQEQITSWKQPEGSEGSIPSGRQQGKQSINSKNLDDFHETTSASEKSIDSEQEDSFSNDEAPTPPPPPPPPPPPKRQHRTKTRPERTTSNSNNNSENKDIKSPTSNNNTSLAIAANSDASSNIDKSNEHSTNLDMNDDSDSNDENKCKRESSSREESQDNEDDCDKKATKKRPREDDSDADANTTNTDISVKQDPDTPKEGGFGASGDPLSALETMVEKSFDPRMRPGLASGGILQRLGIDEEVCPPWQHINYANWYTAAAYGHPMAAALLAAGINLQHGIKLSKNMGSKKSDD